MASQSSLDATARADPQEPKSLETRLVDQQARPESLRESPQAGRCPGGYNELAGFLVTWQNMSCFRKQYNELCAPYTEDGTSVSGMRYGLLQWLVSLLLASVRTDPKKYIVLLLQCWRCPF